MIRLLLRIDGPHACAATDVDAMSPDCCEGLDTPSVVTSSSIASQEQDRSALGCRSPGWPRPPLILHRIELLMIFARAELQGKLRIRKLLIVNCDAPVA
jgi:hypothetical protein